MTGVVEIRKENDKATSVEDRKWEGGTAFHVEEFFNVFHLKAEKITVEMFDLLGNKGFDNLMIVETCKVSSWIGNVKEVDKYGFEAVFVFLKQGSCDSWVRS